MQGPPKHHLTNAAVRSQDILSQHAVQGHWRQGHRPAPSKVPQMSCRAMCSPNMLLIWPSHCGHSSHRWQVDDGNSMLLVCAAQNFLHADAISNPSQCCVSKNAFLCPKMSKKRHRQWNTTGRWSCAGCERPQLCPIQHNGERQPAIYARLAKREGATSAQKLCALPHPLLPLPRVGG